jgi:hypothetical protein
MMVCAVVAFALPTSAWASTPEQRGTTGDLVGEVRLVSAHATDGSVDAITDEDQFTMVSLGVGWGFEQILPGLRGYATYTTGGVTNTRLGSELTWEWGRSLVLAEAEWGPTLFEFFRPWVRLGAGYALHSLRLDTQASPQIYDYAHDVAVKPSAGFDVFLPMSWSARAFPFSVGLSTEFGYLFMTEATYDELRYENEGFVPEGEDDPFTRETPDLGNMNSNGFYWNIGLQARVRF